MRAAACFKENKKKSSYIISVSFLMKSILNLLNVWGFFFVLVGFVLFVLNLHAQILPVTQRREVLLLN